ncbi:type IV conjugative transfer system protein TraV [Rodentibacter sp. JRC1]|uniref:type IV conjugative transfer system lipoprotein TraV n=1 Tax=Rodentibacter sp. JRC1 TaxID=2874504 RepID=UPI001CFF2DA8|nr:type IV conjugative transfer system lipoprotein TraV [Rodentibacter sp. JRC1]GJI56957.1 type IV conjugative transfer system protein TraV [Rodentibacter sp. JRC1]
MYKKMGAMLMVSILTGCAGMNSDFEHNIPAKDSGYWLQQADDMTNPNMINQGTGNIGFMGGRVDVKQYRLINTNAIRLPIKNINTAPFPVQKTADNVKDEFEPIQISYKPTASSNTVDCNQKYCYPEPGTPFRRDDSVSRVWIAPYVSPNDNAHLGEIVYFVTKKSQWSGIEESKGGK